MSVKIIDARKSEVEYSEIKTGQSFLWESELYIKGDEKRNPDDDCNLAVEVDTGCVVSFSLNEQVTPVNLEIRIV